MSETGVKNQSLLLRIALSAGLPRVVETLAKIREDGGVPKNVKGVGLLFEEQQQLDEMRELYKSCVTDFFPGELDELQGAELVAKARLMVRKLDKASAAKARNFLAVYEQLFL